MFWFAVIGVVVIGWIVLVTLFTPAIDYHVRERVPTGTADFLRMLRAYCQTTIHGGNRVEVYTNGPSFYPAMIAAIRQARHTVNIECYIFMPGKVADEFVDALIDRAQNGVVVSLVADAIGSMWLFGKPVDKLRAAGCRVNTYQTIKWYSLARLNNRTHRELLRHRRQDRLHRRRRRRGLVGARTQGAAALARHDGARRRPGGRRASRACSPRTGWSAAARSSPVTTTSRRSTSRATARRSSSRARRRIARPRCAWCFRA